MKRYKQVVVPTMDSSWDNLILSELTQKAKEFYTNDLLETSVKNIHKGVVISFVKSGMKHVLNFGGRSYIGYKAIKLLRELIKYAEFKNFGMPNENAGKTVLGFLNFEAKANIEGKNYKISINIRITTEGKFHYHHAKKIR